ncbi:MAG: hypothetical protein PWR27_928 [Petroclostridium sp.]|nr:hypothetical protein [Petroclostridium sp.]
MFKLIAGVDIGNSTTEVCIAAKDDIGTLKFLSTGLTKTTGIKGTLDNISGIITALEEAVQKAGIRIQDLAVIRINEATPVISETAMETISETVIVESSMIGHNPSTPGGRGIATGITREISKLLSSKKGEELIVVIPEDWDYEDAARIINQAVQQGIYVRGAIVQKDDAVLISNRLIAKIPIVDEVTLIHKVPLEKLAAVEVAGNGETIKVLSNPYGLASIFNLSPAETKNIIPISRSLIGNRSAVVIKTPGGDVKNRKIPAGKLTIRGDRASSRIDVMDGAHKIMAALSSVGNVEDIAGEAGTNVGGMMARVKGIMAQLTRQPIEDLNIRDILAVDTFIPVKVAGGLAGEYALENAVLLAAMVRTNRLPMESIARELSKRTGVYVKIAGAEANMALLGALTTPGTEKPLAVLDMGGGSTDAALIGGNGSIKSIHLAGAGDMVTMLINSELALEDKELAESIKKFPLAKVESLLHLRFEDGSVQFSETPLDPELYARVVVVTDEFLIPIKSSKQYTMEKIQFVRREAKRKVFITNALRALTAVAPEGNIRNIGFVVMVGGSALDFEIPEMISNELSQYRIVAGRGNIRGTEGPRNAVATGLVLSE